MTNAQIKRALRRTTVTDDMLAFLSEADGTTTKEAFAERFGVGAKASEAILQLWWERKL